MCHIQLNVIWYIGRIWLSMNTSNITDACLQSATNYNFIVNKYQMLINSNRNFWKTGYKCKQLMCTQRTHSQLTQFLASRKNQFEPFERVCIVVISWHLLIKISIYFWSFSVWLIWEMLEVLIQTAMNVPSTAYCCIDVALAYFLLLCSLTTMLHALSLSLSLFFPLIFSLYTPLSFNRIEQIDTAYIESVRLP